MSNTANSHWSFRLTRIAGIDVRVHLTFFLLLVWIGLSVWEQTRSQTAVLQGMAFVLTLFACVVLHEFGHALTARRFGIRTRRITLWPIGGVASMERMPDDPKQEILVALAGPAVNVVIAAALWLMLTAADYQPVSVAQDPAALFIDGGAFVYNIMVINVVLAVFNMLPAFPMDGGRVLRASLALAMPH
ncbi:MAG: site-2 protease family protein, partial [Alcanivoracaceae bacterium]